MRELRAIACFHAAIEQQPGMHALQMLELRLEDAALGRRAGIRPEQREDPAAYLTANQVFLGDGRLHLFRDPAIDGGQIFAR